MEESDDDSNLLSVSSVSPAESVMLEEELPLDQLKDFGNQDKSATPEGIGESCTVQYNEQE